MHDRPHGRKVVTTFFLVVASVLAFVLVWVSSPAYGRSVSSHRWTLVHHKRHHHKLRHHATPKKRAAGAVTHPAGHPVVTGPASHTAPAPVTATYQPPMIAATTEGDCLNGVDPGPWARAHGASIIKVGIPDYVNPAWHVEDCLRKAQAEGFRLWIDIVIPRDGRPLADDVAWVNGEIDRFASFKPWAVSIGNEQELGKVTMTGEFYRQVWDQTEPHLAQRIPAALPVFGEVSPCNGCFAFLKGAWGSSRPVGVRAVGYHFYATVGTTTAWNYGASNSGLNIMPEVGAWAQANNVQLWDSEASPASNAGHGFLMIQSVAQYEAFLKQQIGRTPGGVPVVDKYLWAWIGGAN